MNWSNYQIYLSRRKLMLASIIIGLCLISTYIPQTNADGDHPWCYDDEKCAPKHWGGLCKTGHAQSPIDLHPDRARNGTRLRTLKINHEYRQVQPRFYIKNNGHTIQVQLTEEMTSSLKLVGDGLPGRYQFSQMHFHWGSQDQIGSEHTVGGASYAMEAHLVHFSDNYENILSALSDRNPRAIAVVGIFFQASRMDNPALTPITDAIAEVRDYHPDPFLINKPGLNLSALYPDILQLFRYDGSLTTPSCAEKVVWTVFRQPVPISQKQLAAFRSVLDVHGKPLIDNYRPPQPVSTRNRVIVQGTYRLGEMTEADDKDNEINVDDVTDKSAKSKQDHGPDTHEHDDDGDSTEHDENGKSGSSSLNFNKMSYELQFISIIVPCSIAIANYLRSGSNISFKMFEPI